jgi:uncharacterized protein YwlG (UPF0340 family)
MSSDERTVYLAIKFHADHRNRKLVDWISAVFEKHGLATVCVARDMEEWGRVSFDAHDLMQHAFAAIRHSAAVVVEFTEKGVGLGIEAGFAAALDIPIFVLLRSEAEAVPLLTESRPRCFGTQMMTLSTVPLLALLTRLVD